MSSKKDKVFDCNKASPGKFQDYTQTFSYFSIVNEKKLTKVGHKLTKNSNSSHEKLTGIHKKTNQKFRVQRIQRLQEKKSYNCHRGYKKSFFSAKS